MEELVKEVDDLRSEVTEWTNRHARLMHEFQDLSQQLVSPRAKRSWLLVLGGLRSCGVLPVRKWALQLRGVEMVPTYVWEPICLVQRRQVGQIGRGGNGKSGP